MVLSALSSLAFAGEVKKCTPEDFQLLERSVGPKKALVDQYIYLEQFQCQVEVIHRIFPAVCGHRTFTEFKYKIDVAGRVLKATVHSGGISCTGMKFTELKSATVN